MRIRIRRAFERLGGDAPSSTLIASGTGSGKTECFLYPVLEHCRQQRAEGRRGIKVILIYPMNALAADQANRLAKEIVTRPAFAGLTAGLYVGDKSGDESTTVRQIGHDAYTVITHRERLREEPPDILLTNYKMLDFPLIRAGDSVLWRHNAPDMLRFLVVDELHTFDGAQGTDLACLIRRLKSRLRTPPGALACVGTSATLGTEGNDRLLVYASAVFGESIDEAAVIGECRAEGLRHAALCAWYGLERIARAGAALCAIVAAGMIRAIHGAHPSVAGAIGRSADVRCGILPLAVNPRGALRPLGFLSPAASTI